MAKADLTAARLREILHYDPETGVFTWRVNRGGSALAGSKAGHPSKRDGYVRINVYCCLSLAHRLAWMYVHGVFPKNHLDHINGHRDDNRICNLREATCAQNNQNQAIRSDNKSGLIGVSWHQPRGKWKAQIQFCNANKHLGLFCTKEEAHAAYLEAKLNLHLFNPVPRSITQ